MKWDVLLTFDILWRALQFFEAVHRLCKRSSYSFTVSAMIAAKWDNKKNNWVRGQSHGGGIALTHASIMLYIILLCVSCQMCWKVPYSQTNHHPHESKSESSPSLVVLSHHDFERPASARSSSKNQTLGQSSPNHLLPAFSSNVIRLFPSICVVLVMKYQTVEVHD